MPDVHYEERKEHWWCIECVDKVLVMIDICIQFRALRGGEFHNAEHNPVLYTKRVKVQQNQ